MQYIKQDGQTTLFLVKEDADAGKLSNIVGFQELENGEILVVFTVFDFHTEDERYYIYDSRQSLRTGRYLLRRVEEGLTNFGKIIDKYMIGE
ncbi:hypothetical protein bthur0014_55660 [Bacillus thuringiensis IBL 4222]|nr:hypothetical protein bthur0010_51840 [Bacillus thuringiensis serovar pondicheriensis BGSC 4BA1]EEN00071.1 hypothetical protein bthur0014_55660 [Bacillus thuringiensis IBL 4222]